MAEPDKRIFRIEPVPYSVDPELRAWLDRQFRNLQHALSGTGQVQIGDQGNLEDHLADLANPHQVTHAQLPDKGSNDHAAIDTHIGSTSNPHSVTHAQLPDNGTNDHAAIDVHIAAPEPHTGVVSEGGAGLFLSAPTVAFTSITPSYQVLNIFDSKDTPERDAVADTSTGLIQINETGFWVVTVTLVLEVVSSSANTSREIAIRFYEPDGPTLLPILDWMPIPRYGEGITLKGSIRFGTATGVVGESFGIAIWSPSGDTVTVSSIETAEFSVHRASHKDTVPTAR